MALLDVILGYDCNLACDYCTIAPAMRARALGTGAVLRAMDGARADGFDAISFTGGEPTIRPDLVGLVRAARSRGFLDVKVQSNGLLYAHGPNVDRLVDAGASRFHVSIHTHDGAAYEAMVRRAGTFAAMVAGLDQLLARGLRVTADLILTRSTMARLPDAVRWLAARGVRSAHLWFVSLTDGNAGNVASMPRMTEAMPVVRETLAVARAAGVDLRSLHIPRCLLGDDHPHALDPGAGRVRVVTPDATFELRDSKLAGHVHVAACDPCAHRAICPGIRPDYLARYGDGEFGASPAPARRHLAIV